MAILNWGKNNSLFREWNTIVLKIEFKAIWMIFLLLYLTGVVVVVGLGA